MPLILDYTCDDSNVIAACWRKVRCEHCGIVYVIRVEAKVRAPETRGFRLGDKPALERISPDTERHIAYVLHRRIESVPCPSCWRYQPDMCDAIRYAKLGWMRTASVVLLALSGWGMWLIFSNPFSNDPLPANALLGVQAATLTMALVGLAILILKRRRWAAYDANGRVSEENRRDLARSKAMTEVDFSARHPGVAALEREPALKIARARKVQ
jgi:hypothetical protein